MTGIYGGTFDPPHEGHVHLVSQVLKQFPFEKFYIVPTSKNPLKDTSPRIDKSVRLELVKAAFLGISDKIEILDWELGNEGASYTVDTLTKIKSLSGTSELSLILGNEAFNEFPKWKSPSQILMLANLIVIRRLKEKMSDPTQILHQIGMIDFEIRDENHLFLRKENHQIDVVEIHALPYSSTEIRSHIAEMWNAGTLADPPQGIQRSVWLLIKGNSLYHR